MDRRDPNLCQPVQRLRRPLGRDDTRCLRHQRSRGVNGVHRRQSVLRGEPRGILEQLDVHLCPGRDTVELLLVEPNLRKPARVLSSGNHLEPYELCGRELQPGIERNFAGLTGERITTRGRSDEHARIDKNKVSHRSGPPEPPRRCATSSSSWSQSRKASPAALRSARHASSAAAIASLRASRSAVVTGAANRRPKDAGFSLGRVLAIVLTRPWEHAPSQACEVPVEKRFSPPDASPISLSVRSGSKVRSQVAARVRNAPSAPRRPLTRPPPPGTAPAGGRCPARPCAGCRSRGRGCRRARCRRPRGRGRRGSGRAAPCRG